MLVRSSLILILLVGWIISCGCGFLYAQSAQSRIPAYEHVDVATVLEKKEGADGKVQFSLNTELIEKIIDGLQSHAGGYPTKFASRKDEKQAREDVGKLSKILKLMTKNDDAEPQLLHHSAKLHAMAHNMGLKDASEQADRCYRLLAERFPESAQIKFELGRFLFFSNRMDEGITYLRQADRLDHDKATFSLGVAYAVTGKKENALYCLRQYLQRHPNDKNTERMIKAVEEDQIEILRQQPGGDSDDNSDF